MIIPKIIVWSFVTIVSTVNARIIGKQWGWGRALKPNGLNTIVLNECLSRRSVFFHQHHSNSEGEQVARLLGEVSTSVTSRAIMDIITLANGHSPISSCSQEELEEMESEYETCVNKHQYKLKCFNLSKDQQCKTITDFLEECTDRILGEEWHFCTNLKKVSFRQMLIRCIH